ncbi:MAG: aldehyde dehydrogenase family protein [Prochlorococcaceae cyanobacterium]
MASADQPQACDQLEAMRGVVVRGESQPLAWRLSQLDRLEAFLAAEAETVLAALAADLGKPPLEAYFELLSVRQELRLCRRRLRGWMAPRRVGLPLSLWPGRAELRREPLGCVLIIGPFNYPFQLCIRPLVSALAAGNTAFIKPSEQAPHTAALLAAALPRHFPADVLQVVVGDREVSAALVRQHFDHIFFTGSGRVGRQVMAAAAEQLTPVTLELGGKSPAIVLADADLAVTARRLAWGKSLNAGQTCIAPDHLLVQESVREPLVAALAAEIRRFYGDDPLQSPDLGTIINAAQFGRLERLLAGARQRGQVLAGGRSDPLSRRIEPTLVAIEDPDDPLMQEELFGPILPVLAVADLNEALASVARGPQPLALYLFSSSRQAQEQTLRCSRSGGVAFNDVILQAAVPGLPFGGVGESGMGLYHGEAGFLAFSHQRSVLRRPFWLDLPLRYPPYQGKLPWIQRLLG